MDPSGRIAGGCCGDKGVIGNTRYKVYGDFDW